MGNSQNNCTARNELFSVQSNLERTVFQGVTVNFFVTVNMILIIAVLSVPPKIVRGNPTYVSTA
jgi:hypothetical protein